MTRCFVAVVATLFIASPGARVGAETFDLATANLADINAAIDAGALSSERLVELYLARIDAYDRQGPALNTVITLNDSALEQARALDREREAAGRRSPLHGIPIVLKDLIDVAGMPTTAGFVPFGAPVPPRDSTVAARLQAAGAIVLAKVSTANWFGNGFDATHPIGPSINAYNADYSPGGSSNGPGVAMSAYFAALAIGTDTGGSVMIPSAYNSLAGMIATQGLVSRAGIVPRGGTQDRAGPMARNVYDLAVGLGVIAGWDAEDFVTHSGFGKFPAADWPGRVAAATLGGRRIGVLREMIRADADAEVLAVFEQALQDMSSHGALIVDPVTSGVDLATLATSSVGRTAEYEKLYVQNAYLARLGAAAPYPTIEAMMESVGHAKFSRLMREALELPDPATSAEYASRLKTRQMMIELLESTMERYLLDALVLPFRSYPPPALEGEGGGGGGNSLASNNGLPAVMVPAGYTSLNLPIGIQFVGGYFDDLAVLETAHAYERVSRRRRTPATTPALPGERFEY
jgi:Asp-tRNA(Asn)/Glu-tRNA(Gln) amidotransferase A subunit family amidase